MDRRNSKGERKGGEELRNGTGPVPQVPHREGSRVGGAVEEVCRGVRGTTAGGTEVIRAPPDPLQVAVESRREPGPQLGKGGTGGSGKGELLL